MACKASQESIPAMPYPSFPVHKLRLLQFRNGTAMAAQSAVCPSLLKTVNTIVAKQAVPPIRLETGSARNTP